VKNIDMAQDFLLEGEAKQVVEKTINGRGWHFGQFSSNDPQVKNFPFWMLTLDHDPFFTGTMFAHIQQTFRKKFTLERVYANGQTYGLPGSFHQDSQSALSYTFLYYANPEWNPMWGGETMIQTPDRGIVAVTPMFNSGVLFPGDWWHMGKEPTRHFEGLRVTVAFKLLFAGDM